MAISIQTQENQDHCLVPDIGRRHVAALHRHLPVADRLRTVRFVHGCGHRYRKRGCTRRVFRSKDHGQRRADVGQLSERFLRGGVAQPAYRNARPEDVGGNSRVVDRAVSPNGKRCRAPIRRLRCGEHSHDLHGHRPFPLRQRLYEGRGVHPDDLGYLLREMGMDADFLEPCRDALHLLLQFHVHRVSPAL